MSDQKKLEQIKRLYDNATPFGYQELEIALPIIESLEDSADRDSYISICAEWLAQHGELKDLDRALTLIKSTKLPVPKYSGLIAIALRFAREGHRQDALDTLAAAEATALELKESVDHTELEKASAWNQIGDSYNELGELAIARKTWLKAVDLAQVGQHDIRQQEAHDNAYLLFTLVKKLAENGHVDDAIKIANSILIESWRQAALDELQKK